MSALDEFEATLETRLDDWRARGLERHLEPARGLDLVSNDTLGLARHPHLRARMRAALAEGPAGAAASRLLGGEQPAFAALEERLARLVGAPAALLFGSGWAANLGLLATVVERGDAVLSDALNHASLIDGLRLAGAERVIYPHQDLEALERSLALLRAAQPRRRLFVVTESLFSMDGDLTPLVALAECSERHGALLIVDEAHATGVFGPAGAGRVAELGLRGRVLASVHTGGKALGAGGAWVAGSRRLREVLLQRARSFVFSTAPLPVLAAALDAALDLLAREPWRAIEARRKADLLRTALRAAGLPAGGDGPLVPVLVGDNDAALRLQAALQAEGFDVRAVRPPTVPAGSARLRLSVHADVPEAELLRLAALLARAWEPACGRALGVPAECPK